MQKGFKVFAKADVLEFEVQEATELYKGLYFENITCFLKVMQDTFGFRIILNHKLISTTSFFLSDVIVTTEHGNKGSYFF